MFPKLFQVFYGNVPPLHAPKLLSTSITRDGTQKVNCCCFQNSKLFFFNNNVDVFVVLLWYSSAMDVLSKKKNNSLKSFMILDFLFCTEPRIH